MRTVLSAQENDRITQYILYLSTNPCPCRKCLYDRKSCCGCDSRTSYDNMMKSFSDINKLRENTVVDEYISSKLKYYIAVENVRCAQIECSDMLKHYREAYNKIDIV